MRTVNGEEYFRHKSFTGYALARFLHGDVGRTVVKVWSKIRKYTFISSIIRIATIVIALLEKSALLLLLATAILLLLPIIIVSVTIYAVVCLTKYILIRRNILEWLTASDTVTVFITKERVFSNGEPPLFVRHATALASDPTAPVILICSDSLYGARWMSLNAVAFRTEIFFILKRDILEKMASKTTYIVI